ncbi:sensor histidine kinase [Kitasatospora sp. NPDC059571]|uniref:sensor histidine kinase n=1 Tax=Kitasatospora sp. NPDC059571 TaxID=3346871 RepID=UPI0036C66C61
MKAFGRLTGWFRARSLRSRLAMLTAAAVAVAIALAAVACWFVVKNRLYQQAQDSLRNAPSVSAGPGDHRQQLVACGTSPQAAAESAAKQAAEVEAAQPNLPPFGSRTPWASQLLSSSGTICTPLSTTAKGIVVEQSDYRVLGQPPNKPTFRLGTYSKGGDPAMVRVSSVTLTVHDPATQQDTTGDYVLLTATSLKDTQDSLRELAFTLLGVAALGVVGAGFTGRIVARSALRPVDQLTDAVEHIARTEEVGTTIPVHGHDEIARLSTSFNSMSTALLNSRERQTRLIADAGHELRTPLTSLRTNVDLLIRSDDTGRPLPPATRTKLLGNMKAQMQELTLLIGDLLELSRPDSPKPGQKLSVVALHEIADRAVERARLRGPGLVFDVAIDPWYVHGDAAALERAVINLLDNAVKYSPPGGSVDVALAGGRLTVRDHGPGIPQDELPYVFDRFWRSPSSRQLPGSGLGLSIVAQTVRDTGGEVSLGPANDGGPGALATVLLPGQPDPPQ